MHSQFSLFFLTLLARFALAQTTTDIGFLYPASYIGGDDSSREVWQLGDSKLISWNVPNNGSSFRISLVQSLDGTDDGSPAQVMQLYGKLLGLSTVYLCSAAILFCDVAN